MNQTRKRLTYWLLDSVSARHRDFAMLLDQKGFDVHFFTSLTAMLSEIQAKRAGIIVVDDEGSKQAVEKAIMTISNMPEIQGARLILSTSGKQPEIVKMAAWCNFRDVLPIDLEEHLWINRFLYSTAGKALNFQQPHPQVTMSSITAASIPARIAWIGERLLRIECRLTPPLGSSFTLTGHLADTLGLSGITAVVERVERSNLVYRFSDAIVASWRYPLALEDSIKSLLEGIRASAKGPRPKLFLALQSTPLRNELLQRLDNPKFDIKVALQKQSIVEEPKYFAPDVIFIEDILCTNDEGLDRYQRMLINCPSHTTIVVLGVKANRDKIKSATPGSNSVIFLQHLPRDLDEAIYKRYLTNKAIMVEDDPNAAYLMPEDSMSYASVHVPARLSRIHPSAIQLQLPYSIGNFSLFEIDSPWLKKLLHKNPHGKVTKCYKDPSGDNPNFPYIADCYFADFNQHDRRKLAHSLVSFLNESLNHSDRAMVSNLPSTPNTKETNIQQFSNIQSLTIEERQKKLQNDLGFEPSPQPNVAPVASTARASKIAEPAKVKSLDTHREKIKSKAKRKSGSTISDNAKYFLIFCMFTLVSSLVIWLLVTKVAPEYNQSGGQYTDSLRKMAPDKFEGH